MTIHNVHPDTHTHGLADDCPRCAEHAENPIRSLDHENLRRIMELAVDQGGSATYLDQVAAANVLTTLERAGHLARTDPDIFFTYLQRYGIFAVTA
jgi:hypothetical protein